MSGVVLELNVYWWAVVCYVQYL